MQLEVLKATTETKEITYKVAYGLPLLEQFRWGLYVSNPRNFRETESPFPEPALFLLNPDGELQIVDYSNSPFARPDLRILVEGEASQSKSNCCMTCMHTLSPATGVAGGTVVCHVWTLGIRWPAEHECATQSLLIAWCMACTAHDLQKLGKLMQAEHHVESLHGSNMFVSSPVKLEATAPCSQVDLYQQCNAFQVRWRSAMAIRRHAFPFAA